MNIKTDPKVESTISSYPKDIQPYIQYLRKLIREVADEQGNIKELEETLKWGEPSFLVKKGSTIRIAWKEKTPDQYSIYFKCTSKLVETFKQLYPDFRYEKTRAIHFKRGEELAEKELKHCIQLALTYHSVKHLENLGAI
jgi:hypothetical protein